MTPRDSHKITRRSFLFAAATATVGLSMSKVLGPGTSQAAAAITTLYQDRHRDVSAPAQTFDLIQFVQDFPANAYLGWHSHDFPVFALILSGQASLRGGETTIYYKAGKGIQCGPGLHTMGNDLAGSTMRRVVTLLNPPGLPAAVSGEGPFKPSKGPSTLFAASRGTVAEPPAAFDFVQALVGLEAGAVSAPYTASGYTLWTVVQGQVAVDVAGKASDYATGASVFLQPGEKAIVSNPGTSDTQLAMSTMLAPGAPINSLAQGHASAPVIKPPSTGSGGLR